MTLRSKEKKERIGDAAYMTDRTLLWLEGEINPGFLYLPTHKNHLKKYPSSSSLEVNYDSNSEISTLSSVSTLEGSLNDEITIQRKNSSRCNRITKLMIILKQYLQS